MTRHAPDISLVVNTFRKPRHLALVLESIALQRGAEGRFEVIVADDGSDDGTAEIVADFAGRAPFPVAVTDEPHDGFRLARVRNRGAALARGATLLFLDGDSILPRDHVAAHLSRRRPGRALIGDVVRLPDGACRDLDPATLAALDPLSLAPPSEIRRITRRHRRAVVHGWIGHPSKPRLAGGNFSVWRDDYRRVNGSDERFRGWGQEDDDLGLRLRAAGVVLESILDRTCTFHVWHPTDPSATPRWRDGVNVPYFLRRGRLTRCRVGLRRREVGDVVWGIPRDADGSSLGRRLRRRLAGAVLAAEGEPAEIDVALWPGSRRFSRRSECRLLLVEAGRRGTVPRGLGRAAHRVAEVGPDDEARLAEVLDDAG